ncbi:MAG: phosphonate C-P lyase system protein PhnG [Kiritimatiellia bacterium]
MTSSLETEFRDLLQHLDSHQVQTLMEPFAHLELRDLHEPETGLVMLTALDCYHHPFHVGELLVTRAEIEFDGIRAHATVMGDAAEKALLAAMLNAILRHDLSEELSAEFRKIWPPIAASARSRIDEERGVAATTKVAFENMAEEEEL